MDGETWNSGAPARVHLDRYGHTVYNLDFANPFPPTIGSTLDTLGFYVKGEGEPLRAWGKTATRREAAALAVRSRLDTPRQGIFDPLSGGRKASRRCVKTPSPTLVWPGP